MNSSANFADQLDLVNHLQQAGNGHLVIGYYTMPEYPGMARYMGFRFDFRKNHFELNLEWTALGLDPYGDTLQESYVYGFSNPEQLLDYLSENFGIRVSDIPRKYSFDQNFIPLAQSEEQRLLYDSAWNRFREDFRQKLFLDTRLPLLYSSSPC